MATLDRDGPQQWPYVGGATPRLYTSGRFATDNDLRTWWQPTDGDKSPTLTSKLTQGATARSVSAYASHSMRARPYARPIGKNGSAWPICARRWASLTICRLAAHLKRTAA